MSVLFSNNSNYIKFYSLQIIYGGLPDENRQEEEEILGRRTRGRKINYREEMASDSEEVSDFNFNVIIIYSNPDYFTGIEKSINDEKGWRKRR